MQSTMQYTDKSGHKKSTFAITKVLRKAYRSVF